MPGDIVLSGSDKDLDEGYVVYAGSDKAISAGYVVVGGEDKLIFGTGEVTPPPTRDGTLYYMSETFLTSLYSVGIFRMTSLTAWTSTQIYTTGVSAYVGIAADGANLLVVDNFEVFASPFGSKPGRVGRISSPGTDSPTYTNLGKLPTGFLEIPVLTSPWHIEYDGTALYILDASSLDSKRGIYKCAGLTQTDFDAMTRYKVVDMDAFCRRSSTLWYLSSDAVLYTWDGTANGALTSLGTIQVDGADSTSDIRSMTWESDTSTVYIALDNNKLYSLTATDLDLASPTLALTAEISTALSGKLASSLAYIT